MISPAIPSNDATSSSDRDGAWSGNVPAFFIPRFAPAEDKTANDGAFFVPAGLVAALAFVVGGSESVVRADTCAGTQRVRPIGSGVEGVKPILSPGEGTTRLSLNN